MPNEDRLPVSRLRNLGPKSATMLNDVGIGTIAELREIGAARAYARVKSASRSGVSLNLLWSIAAGLDDRDWRDLSESEKSILLSEFKQARR
jgi:DNA transformation protein